MTYLSVDRKREYGRVWIAQRRAEFFDGKCCARCESTERLELHHKDPTQKITNNIWSWSEERRKAEIAKCEVLCHQCHLIETGKQRRAHIEHGTFAGYDTLGCRCQPCRKASSDYRRWLRERRQP